MNIDPEGIRIPDSKLAREITQLVRDTEPPEPIMAKERCFTNATGSPVANNTNILTAGPRGPALLQDIW